MSKINQNFIIIFIFVFVPILSLFIGFYFNEDLSTGGSKWDFNVTWPVVLDYSNFNFFDAKTLNGKEPRHFPFHYLILSFFYQIFNHQDLVRLTYLFFSFLFPVFLYLNLIKIYNYKKIIILILSFSFLFFPFYRSSALWPNAHLTALIFFLISNYFYLKALNTLNTNYKYLNLLFLAFATYSLQTYVVLFLFYLYNYFVSQKKILFFKLFSFCCALGIPPLYFLIQNERMFNLPVTQDYFYNLTNNFSIFFFFLVFLISNKFNINVLIIEFRKLQIKEISVILIFFVLVIYNLDYEALTSNLRGGGFFYKISHFILKNNLIFLLSFFSASFLIYVLIKYDKRFLYLFLLINIMGLNYQIYQKYFEPLLLVMIFILFKNFLASNILAEYKNVFKFYAIVIIYFFISLINVFFSFSKGMTV
ncbi:hypothetical protein [Candidatus Pelagibacter sp.]|uniref:hypothetical protein n=1 Tax=Candidatus Pelagibacter sp. TaxID=2024849 RepID=UPI003F846EC6